MTDGRTGEGCPFDLGNRSTSSVYPIRCMSQHSSQIEVKKFRRVEKQANTNMEESTIDYIRMICKIFCCVLLVSSIIFFKKLLHQRFFYAATGSGAAEELFCPLIAATSAAKSSTFFSMPSPTTRRVKPTIFAPFSSKYFPTVLSLSLTKG